MMNKTTTSEAQEDEEKRNTTAYPLVPDESRRSTLFHTYIYKREYIEIERKKERKRTKCSVCDALIGNRRPWRLTKLQCILHSVNVYVGCGVHRIYMTCENIAVIRLGDSKFHDTTSLFLLCLLIISFSYS